ncbi:MAG TPA: hypothetical protein VFV78_11150 [Vicinamibacterales bacterium]|nr:hypothetical protein [Vicinamibacterales bacterium]
MIARAFAALAAALLFLVLATANAGGYRYGVSDQAFYIPALARSIDASLFPRDAPVLAPQQRAWLGDDVVAAVSRVVPVDLPAMAGGLYVATLLLLAGAVVYFLRGLKASWWAVAAGLAIASLRHRIPETGANTLEGYFHPRVLAFAIGLWALGFAVRLRFVPALALTAAAAVVHPTTALWMGIVVIVAACWRVSPRTALPIVLIGAALAVWFGVSGPRMDDVWLAVIAEKGYLFPLTWPAWAWTINLSYPIVLWLIYSRRVTMGRTMPGEAGLIAATLILMLGFLVSLPLTALHVTIAVQLQITRVLWVLDGVTLLYLAWWAVDDVAAGVGLRWRGAAASLLFIASFVRGWYVVTIDTPRPLVARALPADDWTAAMRFLQSQPVGIHVLADPGHAWMYGSSVRVAALRDTVLESVKDTAMAIYDRNVAMRVGERVQALEGFASLPDDRLREIASRYHADVLVFDRSRPLDFPVLFENARFVIYDVR